VLRLGYGLDDRRSIPSSDRDFLLVVLGDTQSTFLGVTWAPVARSIAHHVKLTSRSLQIHGAVPPLTLCFRVMVLNYAQENFAFVYFGPVVDHGKYMVHTS